MKNGFLFISISLMVFVFNSCQKNIDTVNHSDLIDGTWELEQSQISLLPATNYPVGNGNIIQFSNFTYKRWENGNLIKSGVYEIKFDTTVQKELGLSIPAGQFNKRIIFDNDSVSKKIFFNEVDNRITFLSGYFPIDAGSKLTYIRKLQY